MGNGAAIAASQPYDVGGENENKNGGHEPLTRPSSASNLNAPKHRFSLAEATLVLLDSTFLSQQTSDFANPNFLNSNVKNLSTTPFQDYVLTAKVGFGKYSTVYKGISTRDNKKEVAIKEVKVKDMGRVELSDFRYELNLLSQLSHPAFIKLEAVYDPTGPGAKCYVVSEYLRGGELINALIRNQSYSEEDITHYSFQIISGIHYLHSRGVVHGNIIPENIVLQHQDVNDRERNHVKIVGLDLSQCNHTKRAARNRLIEEHFLAPELDVNHQSVDKNPRKGLKREASILSVATGLSRTISIGGFSLTPTILAQSIMAANQEKEEESNANTTQQQLQEPTKASDIWSFGILLYLLLSGSMPYEHIDPYENNFKLTFYSSAWNKIHPMAKDLLQLILKPNPILRIPAEDILQHPYFAQRTAAMAAAGAASGVTSQSKNSRRSGNNNNISLANQGRNHIKLDENIPYLQEFQRERLSALFSLIVSTRLLRFHKTQRYEEEKTLVFFESADYTKESKKPVYQQFFL